MRFSWRYHAPESRRARSDLDEHSAGPLAQFLDRPAQLGKSVTPEDDYATGTGLTYLTMAGLRWWRVDPTPCPEITEDYAKANADRRLAEGDVLLARSGEGTIGKVGIVEAGIEGCFADFVIRISTDQSRLDPQFLRYMLMTTHYQTLIAAEKKGLGNNTNIFPVQLHEFPALVPDLATQHSMIAYLKAFEADVAEANAANEKVERAVSDAVRSFIL